MAGAAGGVSAMPYMWLFSKARKPDPAMSVNGVLGRPGGHHRALRFRGYLAAVIIGLIGGVLVCLATVWLEKPRLTMPSAQCRSTSSMALGA